MALINCTFFSETLRYSTSITVILPHYSQGQTIPRVTANNPKMKTLYLLHGLHDDHTAWLRQTAIERYVAPLGIAVIMPAVQRSFYTDMVFGGAYESIAFRDFALREGLPLTWKEDPGYGHSWDYWDMSIQRVLQWMF